MIILHIIWSFHCSQKGIKSYKFNSPFFFFLPILKDLYFCLFYIDSNLVLLVSIFITFNLLTIKFIEIIRGLFNYNCKNNIEKTKTIELLLYYIFLHRESLFYILIGWFKIQRYLITLVDYRKNLLITQVI